MFHQHCNHLIEVLQEELEARDARIRVLEEALDDHLSVPPPVVTEKKGKVHYLDDEAMTRPRGDGA